MHRSFTLWVGSSVSKHTRPTNLKFQLDGSQKWSRSERSREKPPTLHMTAQTNCDYSAGAPVIDTTLHMTAQTNCDYSAGAAVIDTTLHMTAQTN